jgi:hypothetical protein
MNEVRVPDEWPKTKKVKFLLICLAVIGLFLFFNL